MIAARHRSAGSLSLLLPALAALLLAACLGDGNAPPTPVPSLTATPAPTETPAPSPTPTPDLSHGGIALIEDAYVRLLDTYIEPLEPAALLTAAWHGATEDLARQGYAPPSSPDLTGDRAAAWEAFRAAYVAAVDAATGADLRQVRYAALQSMAAHVADCHTFFLPPVQAQALSETQTGSGTVGIGVELAPGPPVFLREVLSGGPAAGADLHPGDRVLAVDGEDVSGLTLPEVDERLRGPEGSPVTVTVRRPTTGEELTATMTRQLVRPPTVESEVLPGGIGYLRIRAFVEGGVGEQIDAALRAFLMAGAGARIIDLRDNPGGFLDVPAISRFVPEGVVVRSVSRDGKETTEMADGSFVPPQQPTVILLNSGTGSVAEAFAAALQEHDVAHLIGTTTAGCAGYTSLERLGDGSTLGITIGRNLGPLSGRPLNQPGVIPDEAVDRTLDDIAQGRDPQMERALDYLRSALGG